MTKFVIEILKGINEKPETIVNHAANVALKMCLYYAFDVRNKWLLPEGEPPYKQDAAPIGMSPANFQMETKRFYLFARQDLNATRREALFIQILEGVHPSEAELLLAIKDQDLGRLFPNITYELVTQICPDIPQEYAAVAPSKSEEKPRGKGRPPGSKNKPKDELDTGVTNDQT